MENLAIKVIMQILGGGIRRVHHLNKWVVCWRFPRLPYASKGKLPGFDHSAGHSRPINYSNKTSLGDPEFESCYPKL